MGTRFRRDDSGVRCPSSGYPWRHCERSDAIRSSGGTLDCVVASLLAMTDETGASYNTFFAPGICRNTQVAPQLNNTLPTKAIVALTMAGRLRSNNQYWIHSTIG